MYHYDKAIHRLRKNWWIIDLKSDNFFQETEKMLHLHSNYLGCNQITKFTSSFWNYGGVAMNRQFHNKRQSLTVTNKQAGVGKSLDWPKKSYWSHDQYNRVKVIQRAWKHYRLKYSGQKTDRGHNVTLPPPPRCR